MSLANQPARTITKQMQTHSKRVKPKQTTLGAISPKVRAAVHLRSGGQCELRERCNGAPAAEIAHIRGRRIISESSAEWLRDACVPCHRWLDGSGAGAVLKRQMRNE